MLEFVSTVKLVVSPLHGTHGYVVLVALSRLRSLAGVYLTSFMPNAIMAVLAVINY